VAVRHRRKGDLGQMNLEEFASIIGEDAQSKKID
jgi:threonyl-tRNA synthetase